LKEEFGDRIESIDLIADHGGMHEIRVDGELVYSKLKTGRQPSPKEIVKLVRARLGQGVHQISRDQAP